MAFQGLDAMHLQQRVHVLLERPNIGALLHRRGIERVDFGADGSDGKLNGEAISP